MGFFKPYEIGLMSLSPQKYGKNGSGSTRSHISQMLHVFNIYLRFPFVHVAIQLSPTPEFLHRETNGFKGTHVHHFWNHRIHLFVSSDEGI